MAEPVADIALIGLAVMGQNIILNMNDHGFVVCAFNRTVEKVDQFLANEAKGTNIVGAHSMEEMVAKLKKPRRVMLLVKADLGPSGKKCLVCLQPMTSFQTPFHRRKAIWSISECITALESKGVSQSGVTSSSLPWRASSSAISLPS